MLSMFVKEQKQMRRVAKVKRFVDERGGLIEQVREEMCWGRIYIGKPVEMSCYACHFFHKY